MKLLRRFRDEYLLTNAPGRAFVAFYYEVSPPMADWIAQHEGVRALVRIALWSLIALAWLLLNGWGLLLVLAMGIVLLGYAWRIFSQPMRS